MRVDEIEPRREYLRGGSGIHPDTSLPWQTENSLRRGRCTPWTGVHAAWMETVLGIYLPAKAVVQSVASIPKELDVGNRGGR